jgi:hypothetical protein
MLRIERIDRDVRLGVEGEQAELSGQDLVAAERGGGGAKRDLGRPRAPAAGAAGYDPVPGPVDAAGTSAGRDVHQARILARGHDPRRGAQHLFDRFQQSKFANRNGFAFGPARRRWSHGHEQGGQEQQREDSLAKTPAIAAAARTSV